jgi:hypothetical protein
MNRLRRFEAQRFIGLRDTMLFYDCDDPTQFEELEARMTAEHLDMRNLVQTFAPDATPEARNRGFKPR